MRPTRKKTRQNPAVIARRVAALGGRRRDRGARTRGRAQARRAPRVEEEGQEEGRARGRRVEEAREDRHARGAEAHRRGRCRRRSADRAHRQAQRLGKEESEDGSDLRSDSHRRAPRHRGVSLLRPQARDRGLGDPHEGGRGAGGEWSASRPKTEDEDAPKETYYKTFDERRGAALKQYKEVQAKFPGTGAAILARLAEGSLLLDKRDIDNAIAAFTEVKGVAARRRPTSR